MRFLREFRDPQAAEVLVRRIRKVADSLGEISFMEVCGTHTMSIYRYGIRRLLPPNIRILSGPGCPVCVTPNAFLDRAIALARLPGVTIATFGDMMRVPGSTSSLEREQACGCDIRVVYSPIDALRIAAQEQHRRLVFLGVGFETTAPALAATLLEARRTEVNNFSILSAAKVIPPAMQALLKDGPLRLSGFLCPGHVSTVIGSRPYEPLVNEHGIPCVIAGFEPLDILYGFLMLLEQVSEHRADVEIAYRRAVRPEGNPKAKRVLKEVFIECDAQWRGIGRIEGSGLALSSTLEAHDAFLIEVEVEPTYEVPGCICGLVLSGQRTPFECDLFAKECTPETPQGACMVSAEGTCAAAYCYGRIEEE